MSEDCFIRRKHRGEIADPGRVYEDEVTYVGHLVPPEGTGAYLGHPDEWEGPRRSGPDEIAAFARRLPF